MKKIIALMLCAVMLLALCACEKSEEAPDTDDSVLTIEEAPVDNTAKNKVVDEAQDENALLQSSDEFKATAQIIVNDSEEDTTTNTKIFPIEEERALVNYYIHYYIECDQEELPVRILFEGKDYDSIDNCDEAEEFFTVEWDALNSEPVKANTWNTVPIGFFPKLFYRITLYYGETSQVLATTTIYTPYEVPIYASEPIPDEVPEFHPYSGLNDEEQALLDKTEYAIFDYAKANSYSGVDFITVAETDKNLYLIVIYSRPLQQVCFRISVADDTDYEADDNFDYIMSKEPESAGKEGLRDYYYYRKEIKRLFKLEKAQ